MQVFAADQTTGRQVLPQPAHPLLLLLLHLLLMVQCQLLCPSVHVLCLSACPHLLALLWPLRWQSPQGSQTLVAESWDCHRLATRGAPVMGRM